MKGTIKFIDLFAGIGGIRCGLELAAHEAGYKTECVFTSENQETCHKGFKTKSS
ncbi:DNA cytosine methyltransferase [Parabacteroides distasonis]|nr:DNA cytosine methyltransferase [Parabacteroides distasonis]